jgi:hypothetical protein
MIAPAFLFAYRHHPRQPNYFFFTALAFGSAVSACGSKPM